ncbi:hypothetical protein STAS_27515 [Striga asiatica]|uniref:Uncharacterized protein n=1 Tax=Striga asiatica TaxID=4170 RepID=A0A5A7QYV3_STRAF|nr:hypothetical protein STAS_27515 [Striga asiatica]
MESKLAEYQRSSPRRGFGFSRSGRGQKPAASNNILEAIGRLTGGEMTAAEDGRVKLVVRREDLKQVLKAIKDGCGLAGPAALEQQLNMLWRRQVAKAAAAGQVRGGIGRGSWKPELQSIPEEEL